MQALILGALIVLLSAAGPAGRVGAQRDALDALDGLDPVLLIGGKEVPGKSAYNRSHAERHDRVPSRPQTNRGA